MTILHHAGICVADIDEALRWYRDGVGLNVLVDKVIEARLGIRARCAHAQSSHRVPRRDRPAGWRDCRAT